MPESTEQYGQARIEEVIRLNDGGLLANRHIVAIAQAIRALPVAERMEAMGMVPAMSRPPADCNDDCMDADCTCSGVWRTMAWAPENDAPIRPIADRVRPA